MRKSGREPLKNPVPLRDLLAQALKPSPPDPSVSLSLLLSRWEEIVGPLLSRKSAPLKIIGKRLLIGVAGSSWAQEMELRKTGLMEKLKDLQVEEIRFRIMPKAITREEPSRVP